MGRGLKNLPHPSTRKGGAPIKKPYPALRGWPTPSTPLGASSSLCEGWARDGIIAAEGSQAWATRLLWTHRTQYTEHGEQTRSRAAPLAPQQLPLGHHATSGSGCHATSRTIFD